MLESKKIQSPLMNTLQREKKLLNNKLSKEDIDWPFSWNNGGDLQLLLLMKLNLYLSSCKTE